MPANLEGCIALGLFILMMIAVIGGGITLSRKIDSLVPEIAMWGIIIPAFIAFMRFSKRHS